MWILELFLHLMFDHFLLPAPKVVVFNNSLVVIVVFGDDQVVVVVFDGVGSGSDNF